MGGYVPKGPVSTADVKKKDKLIKSIKTYIKGFYEAFIARKISAPSGGDCWCCMGIPDSQHSHLLAHIKEKYYVPSLLSNAAIEHRSSLSIYAEHIMATWVNGKLEAENNESIIKNQIFKCLDKYLMDRLVYNKK